MHGLDQGFLVVTTEKLTAETAVLLLFHGGDRRATLGQTLTHVFQPSINVGFGVHSEDAGERSVKGDSFV